MRTSGEAGSRMPPRARNAAADARIVTSGLSGLLIAATLAFAATCVAEAKGGSHGSHQSVNTAALRGTNSNNRKGGRYLAPAAKKLPGKRKPPTLTLKPDRHD